MSVVKLAIVGSRSFTDAAAFEAIIDAWIAAHGVPDTIVTGDATGVDAMARAYATEHGLALSVHKAQWNVAERAAGPLRNAEIVRECTAMLALPSNTGRGTQNAIKQALKAGIKPEIHFVQ